MALLPSEYEEVNQFKTYTATRYGVSYSIVLNKDGMGVFSATSGSLSRNINANEVFVALADFTASDSSTLASKNFIATYSGVANNDPSKWWYADRTDGKFKSGNGLTSGLYLRTSACLIVQ